MSFFLDVSDFDWDVIIYPKLKMEYLYLNVSI